MTTTDVADAQLRSRDRKVIATLLIATFVVILNETIMGVALPVLMVDLDLSAGTVQWLTTAFMLTMAVVIPTTGFLLQRFSTRTVYGAALGLFSAGTLLAGVAPGFWVLLLGRIIQASGTAIMLPLLMTTILTLVPIHRRGVVMGNVSIAISVAPAIGPTLSGLILQFLPWRFMFLLVLPIALAALAYGLKGLVNVNADGDQPLDVVSVLLSVPGFGGIVFGLSRLGESSGSAAWVAPVSLVVGVVCLVLFVVRQRALVAGKGPLLDLRAFSFTMFRRGVALLCIAAVALFGAIILLPIYFQNVRGLNTLQTGMLLLPGGLLMGLLGPVVGRLFDKYGPRWLSASGSALLVLTMLALTQVGPTTPIPLLLGIHLTLSTGLAFLFTPAFTTALNPLPPSLYSHGSAILSTLQQVAGAAGVALLVTVVTLRAQTAATTGADDIAAEVAGLHLAFLVAAVIGVVAVALALTLRKTEAVAPGHGPHGEPTGAEPARTESTDAELRNADPSSAEPNNAEPSSAEPSNDEIAVAEADRR
ncbi:DHA2 family efflux MFS transporter permease subunit [Microlunatus aurantiacus]|uniref:DHA2 family efflux MFS transporter permease subunit n=1 Tax=Microlunatus aurantiacus TaxID=446786 RepID=A0ABP7DKK1_9ACTN